MTRSPYLDQSRLLRFLNSPFIIWFSQFFLIRWLIDIFVLISSKRFRARLLSTPTESRLVSTLETIVHDVVTDLGYVGAMVATREPDDSLPVRAYYVDPDVMTQEEIERWERRISRIVFRKIGLKAPIARAYLNNKRFKDNLSVRAVKAKRIVTHHELFSLFTPVVPWPLRGVIKGIQKNKLGVSQVAAVPFFLDGETKPVGNLFVLARNEISEDAKKRLEAFGRMAAIAIENERRLQQEHRLNGQVQALQNTTLKMQSSLKDEQAILDSIVEDVVRNLGYVGAMVATGEDDTLPVKAYFVDPNVITEEEIKQWEWRLSVIVGTDIGLKAPIARTYLYDKRFKNNLSVRAVMGGGGPQVVYDKELFSLFVPVVPEALRRVIWRIQKIIGVGQVIAVPFFLEEESSSSRQVVGNLFVITREDSFNYEEIEILQTFAQQAAIGIRNAQLYRKSESRREIAQVFAKMAFFANTSVHDLNNAIGLISANFKPGLEPDNPRVIRIKNGIKKAYELIQTLADPFQDIPDEPVNINAAIARAARKVEELGSVNIEDCEANLPEIVSSYPILSEVFRIFFKNGLEAMQEAGKQEDSLIVTSQYNASKDKIIVTIRDSGIGIEEKYFSRIFDFKWTTKEAKGGLGFGLFWAKDTIENMGGSIVVNSIVGQGTTFRIFLPVNTVHQDVNA